MILSILVAAGYFASAYGHGYLTIPASRTRLGFEVSVQITSYSLYSLGSQLILVIVFLSRLVLILVLNALS
jgi:hypothetical protein